MGDSIGSNAGEPKCPEAGAWFDYAVKQLATNAHMSPVPAPSPPNTRAMPRRRRRSRHAAPSPTPPAPSTGQCCFGAPEATCATMSSCQGGWCGMSQTNCEGNCKGRWCPKEIVEYEVIV